MSVSTSLMSSPAARTCCGMKLVAVMPGVVFTSIIFILSLPSASFEMMKSMRMMPLQWRMS